MTREPGAVLHLSAAAGGGVERYIRDLAASVPGRHYYWHVGPGMDAIEDIAAHRFFPLANHWTAQHAGAALARWLGAAGIEIAHLHGIDAACRARLALVERASVPWIVTLHDLTFVNSHAFKMSGLPEPEPAWLADVSAALKRAAAIVVPSEFLRDIASRHLPGLAFELAAPGLDPNGARVAQSVPEEFAAQRPRHVVAVVGAIGPHKGSALLDALVARLEGSDIAVVVIGYTDTQITRGWCVPGRYYVHGPYVDHELRGLLAAYGVEVALFPNRMPESFSYTLSEVWAAGIPAIVPDEGALGERVAKRGGGWRLAPRYTAASAAQFLRELFAPESAAERARVESEIDPHDPARIPSLAAMSRELDALYRRFGLPPPPNGPDAAAAAEALEPLLAANLDGFAFRKELVKLANDVVDLKAALAQAKPSVAQLELDLAEAQAWARKLEHDVETLKAEAAKTFEENRRLADDKAAFDELPLLVRKLLLKKVFRARH
jgi:glycosyltransferase involved in cell wall biosynthesis